MKISQLSHSPSAQFLQQGFSNGVLEHSQLYKIDSKRIEKIYSWGNYLENGRVNGVSGQ